MSETLRGQLLIAAPSLFDYFRRTAVLVIEHTAEGAMGVVLNRESETRVADAVPQLADLAAADELVMIGGPVAPQSVVALGRVRRPVRGGHAGRRQARDARPRVGQRVAAPDARVCRLRRLGRRAAGRRARAGGLAGGARGGGRSVHRRATSGRVRSSAGAAPTGCSRRCRRTPRRTRRDSGAPSGRSPSPGRGSRRRSRARRRRTTHCGFSRTMRTQLTTRRFSRGRDSWEAPGCSPA